MLSWRFNVQKVLSPRFNVQKVLSSRFNVQKVLSPRFNVQKVLSSRFNVQKVLSPRFMFSKCCPQGLMFRKCCPQGLMFRKCCPQGLMASCIPRLTDDAVACCFEILLNFEISCLLYLFASCLTPGLIDNLKTSAETTLVNKFGLSIIRFNWLYLKCFILSSTKYSSQVTSVKFPLFNVQL